MDFKSRASASSATVAGKAFGVAHGACTALYTSFGLGSIVKTQETDPRACDCPGTGHPNILELLLKLRHSGDRDVDLGELIPCTKANDAV